MKIRNKLVTLLCMLACAISLAACGEEAGHQEKESKATEEVKDTEKKEKEEKDEEKKDEEKNTETSEEKVQAEAVELGKLYGQKYVNEYIDYGFTLGSEWKVMTYKDIYGIEDDILFGEDVSGVDVTENFFDIYAEIEDGANAIIVSYQKKNSVTEASTGDEMAEKLFDKFDKEEKLLESMKEDYGAEDALVSLVTVKVAGEKRKAVKAEYSYADGSSMFVLELFGGMEPKRPYLVMTTIIAEDEQALDAILAMIKTPEEIIAGEGESSESAKNPEKDTEKEPEEVKKDLDFVYTDDYEEFVCRLNSTGWLYMKDDVANSIADGVTMVDAAYEGYEVPLAIVNPDEGFVVYVGHYKHSTLSQVFDFLLNDGEITFDDEEGFVEASLDLNKGATFVNGMDISMKKKSVEFAGKEHWAIRTVTTADSGAKRYSLDLYLLDSYPYIVHVSLMTEGEDRLDELLAFFVAE